MCVCVCVCVCVFVCECGGGCRHIDDGTATPQADPLSCVTRSQTPNVYTPDHPDPSHLYPSRVPQNLSPWLGKLGGQRLGVNLEVVVPERLSDLTDCSGPDGRYELRSGVKGGHKRKVSWPPIVWLHLPPTRTWFNVVWLQRLEFQMRQMSQHRNASLFLCDVIHWPLSYHYRQLQTAYQLLACSYS